MINNNNIVKKTIFKNNNNNNIKKYLNTCISNLLIRNDWTSAFIT